MDRIHVTTETATLRIITKIIAELWHEKEESLKYLMQYKAEDNLIEETKAEGVIAGLDIAMDAITAVICPEYFKPEE